MIATYALCSFSDFIAAGIQLAVLGGMAPSRKKLLAKIVSRAMLAGNISCLMTASLAGFEIFIYFIYISFFYYFYKIFYYFIIL